MIENKKRNPVIEKFTRTINSICDRIVGVLGAFIFAQIPQFIAQYIQRLGGHIDELTRIVNQYKQAAGKAGMTLDLYIDKMIHSSFKATGENMSHNVERLRDLTAALQDLTTATPYNKLFYFIKDLKYDIYKAVYKNFTPGIPTTWEGVAYAAIGIFCAIFLYYMVKKGLRKLFKTVTKKIKRRHRPQGPPPATYHEQQYNNFDDLDIRGPY